VIDLAQEKENTIKKMVKVPLGTFGFLKGLMIPKKDPSASKYRRCGRLK